MKKIKYLFIMLIILSLNNLNRAQSWELYDQTIAVVNNTAILQSEVNNKFNQLIRLKKIPRRKFLYEKSRILDKYIEDALVSETAADESIVINDSRIISHLQNILGQYLLQKTKNRARIEKILPRLSKRLAKRLKNKDIAFNKKLDPILNRFIKFIERKQGINFEAFITELKAQIRKEQVMSISVGISPPTKKEAMKWYTVNKKKLGYEVWIKHILIKPKSWSLTGERNANKRITEIHDKIASGQSFARLARKYSYDRASAVKGGDMGWVMLAEIAEKDPYFAGFVNTMKRPGQLSKVFKTRAGYHIVKLIKRRPVSFDKVQKMIMYKLYVENMDIQFKQWIQRRKKESEIKIYMKDYIKRI